MVLVLLPSLTGCSSPSVPCRAGLIAHLYAHPSHNPSAVGPLELANALAACCLSCRLSSQHRQWAAQQLVRTLAAHDRDNNQSRPQTFADMAGDLRKCSFIKLEAHQSRVGAVSLQLSDFWFRSAPDACSWFRSSPAAGAARKACSLPAATTGRSECGT